MITRFSQASQALPFENKNSPDFVEGVICSAEKEGLFSMIPWGRASKQSDQSLRVILFFLQHLSEASFLQCFGKTKNPSCEGFDQIASAEKEGFEPPDPW